MFGKFLGSASATIFFRSWSVKPRQWLGRHSLSFLHSSSVFLFSREIVFEEIARRCPWAGRPIHLDGRKTIDYFIAWGEPRHPEHSKIQTQSCSCDQRPAQLRPFPPALAQAWTAPPQAHPRPAPMTRIQTTPDPCIAADHGSYFRTSWFGSGLPRSQPVVRRTLWAQERFHKGSRPSGGYGPTCRTGGQDKGQGHRRVILKVCRYPPTALHTAPFDTPSFF